MKNKTSIPSTRGTVRGVFSTNACGWYSNPKATRLVGVCSVTFWSATGYWTEKRKMASNDPIVISLSK